MYAWSVFVRGGVHGDEMEAKWSNNTRNSFDEKCLLMAGTTTGRRGGS